MIRVIKQYGISILLLIVAIFCLFNIGQNIQDAFTVVTNSLAIFLAIFYFVNFEQDIIIKIKSFVLNIKWPFHGKTKKILTNFLNFIVKKRWDIISYLFLFLLLIIALGQFSYLEKFIDLAWINKYQVIITVLAILSGGLTFWHNRERVEREIENEQIDEQRIEDKRNAEFSNKFPKINKIPVFKNLLKWMYKEGWGYSIPLILIALIFIAIKIGMPIIYNGSYIDEYNHIFSGIEFFKSGHFANIYPNEYYNRGSYVSLLIGLFFKLFGQTIFIAKMVPAILGIINFILLYKVSNYLYTNKKYNLLLLITYAIIPWVIFNHFYIRLSVFYEFFFLLATILLIKAYYHLKQEKIKYAIIDFFSIFSIVLFILLLSNDFGSYLVAFYAFNGIIFLWLFNNTERLKERNGIVINSFVRLFNLNLLVKWIIFIIFIAITVLVSLKTGILASMLNQNLIFGNSINIKYYEFFFNINASFAITFLSTVLVLIVKKDKFSFIYGAAFSTALLMMLLPAKFQVLRGLLFFLPIFYLIALVEIQNFNKFLIKIMLIVIFAFSVINNYPTNFLVHPWIPNEINYMDNNIYTDVLMYCKNSIIITAGNPGIAQFFHVTPDYHYNSKLLISKNAYFKDDRAYEVYTNVPIIKSLPEIESINSNFKNICFIEGGFPNEWVDLDVINFIEKNFKNKIDYYNYTSQTVKIRLFIK